MTAKQLTVGLVVFVFLSVTQVRCAKSPTCHCSQHTIFFASFERAADTAGWAGIVPECFVADPAPGCGKRALRISGGCLQPAAWLTLEPFETDGYYNFSVWGKLPGEQPGGPGAVVLSLKGAGWVDDSTSSARVEGLKWQSLVGPKPIFCPAGRPLEVQLIIGGFVPAAMLIDGLAVWRIK
jgi:hypothetical protein